MEFVDYYVKKMNNIKNKFVVYVVDSDSENEEDSDCFDDAITYTHYLITQKYTKNYDFRTPNINEFSCEELFLMGNTGLFGTLFLYNSQPILMYLFKLLYVSSIISFGFLGSFVTVSYFLNKNELTEEDIKNETEYYNSLNYKYGLFINKHYDTFENIYNDEELMKNEYTNTDEKFLKELKDKDNHYVFDIPIEKNNKLIMYYHDEDEMFHYYTQNSDVLYVVLNACCRDYVYKYNCLNLFQDEEEIEFIKGKNKESAQDIIDSYENVSETEEDANNNTESETTSKSENKSLFYNKNEKKEKINKNQITTKINKFVRKGNLSDYELKFKDKLETKKLNYNEYKALFDKALEK